MTKLAIHNKSLMKSAKDEKPNINELVVAYQVFKPIFASLCDLNGEPEWFEVTFVDAKAAGSPARSVLMRR